MNGNTLFRACIAVALLTAATSAFAQDKTGKAFLQEAIEGNYAEIQMGQLAQQKGQSDGVKSFGQMLVTDHTDANNKALSVAKDVGITPPDGPNKKQQNDYDRLSKLSGAAFDRRFVQDMVMDHRNAIREYERESKAKDPVSQYAGDSLPTLRKHLRTAQSLESGHGVSSR
jgi:putative membrane protein